MPNTALPAVLLLQNPPISNADFGMGPKDFRCDYHGATLRGSDSTAVNADCFRSFFILHYGVVFATIPVPFWENDNISYDSVHFSNEERS